MGYSFGKVSELAEELIFGVGKLFLLSGPESKGLKLQRICSLKYPVLPQRVPIRRRKEKANEEVKNARRYTGSSFSSSESLSVEEEELSDCDYKRPQM